MTVCILTIGDEILNGQTLNTNSSWLAKQLIEIGFEVRDMISVGDTHQEIVDALAYVSTRNRLILTTGGLGPTIDDITKKALADFFEDQLVFDSALYESIVDYLKKRNRTPTEGHRIQCFLPSKAALLENSRGTAPGMWFVKGNTSYLSMPGVPIEMKAIMMEGGIAKIKALQSDLHILFSIIQTAGYGETQISEMISDICGKFPDELRIAYLPSTASVKIRLTAKGLNRNILNQLLENYTGQLLDRLGDMVFAIGDISIEEKIGELLQEKGLMLATAESCTGGDIAASITRIAGSSNHFKGAIIAYSNEVKSKILGVKPETLDEHGAVSEQTVREMLRGVLCNLNADLGIAVSGIAGPSGGTPEKPVGTIWMAVGTTDRIYTEKLQLARDRVLNIAHTRTLALNSLRLFIEKEL